MRQKGALVRFLLGLAVLVWGIFGGTLVYQQQNRRNVVFRVSSAQNKMDYDFMAALAYMKRRFEENGYRVLGTAYAGGLYPKEFDKAAVNVYVRGFEPFYDLRINEKAVNVYYIHRIMEIYREEMQGYDYYLSSQRGFSNAVEKFGFLEGGAVPHEALIPSYKTDVLYIYERYNVAYEAFLQQNFNARVYSGSAFVMLSDEERKQELSEAKLVVYEMGEVGADDKDYVPYAVYDIISYGRPLLTNYKVALEKMFPGMAHWFYEKDELVEMTMKILAIENKKREKMALEAREKLPLFENKEAFFIKE